MSDTNLKIRVEAVEKRLSNLETSLENLVSNLNKAMKNKGPIHSDPAEPDLIFYISGEPVLVLKKTGEVIFKGKTLSSDQEIVEGFRSLLVSMGHIKKSGTILN